MQVLEEAELETGVKSIEQLSQIIAEQKLRGKRVVQCHGVFDLLHIGHIRHLKSAKEHGDILCVTITPDRFVNKGPDRPAFHEELRAEALAVLDMVDYVAINEWSTAVQTLKILKPDIYVKGDDYESSADDVTGGIDKERAAVESVGGQLVFTHDIRFSSSTLINQHFSPLPPEVRDYLHQFSKRYSSKDLIGFLDSLKDLKVLVVGETIIDDYHYCRTMGKSGKEPILAAHYERQETFAGGVLAVANHLAQICDQVSVLSFVGRDNPYQGLIREKLNPAIDAQLLPMHDGCTIVKRRFVESNPLQKLFEVYQMDNDEGDTRDSALLCEQLRAVGDYDVIIAVDYGHGMLDEPARQLLTESAPFLAINCQINAGNHGFNTISKYPRADYVCISEHELRMDARRKQDPTELLMLQACTKLGAPRAMVTRGSYGACCYERDGGFYEIPAFAGQAVDRIGAGDAVLAVTSLCAQRGVPMEAVGLIGNAVGYQAVQTVCNRDPLDRVALYKFLEHTLK